MHVWILCILRLVHKASCSAVSQSRVYRGHNITLSWIFVLLHEVMLKQQLAPLIISADTFSILQWIDSILNWTAGAGDIIQCVKGMGGRSESYSPDYPKWYFLDEGNECALMDYCRSSLLCIEGGICRKTLCIQFTCSRPVSYVALK